MSASNSVVRWGILSTAEITGKVAPALRSAASSVIAAVASRDVNKAREWAAQHAPDARPYGSYDELLADPSVDAVYIPLPSAMRNEWAIKCARAGKHVYAEKPFHGSPDELQSVTDACAAHNVSFMDGTMWVHSLRTRAIEQALSAGAIGAVQRVTSAFTFAAPSEEWLHGGNGRTDKTRETFGCLGDQGWYPVGAIMWAYGYELPQFVQMTHTVLNRVDTIVAGSGFLQFSGNRTASFDFGVTLAHRSWFELCGVDGVIRVDDQVGGAGRTPESFDAYFKPFVGSSAYTQGNRMGADVVVQTTPCDHVLRLVEDFNAEVRAQRGGAAVSSSSLPWPQRTLAAHRVMCALFESACNGNKVVSLSSS